MNEQSQTNLMHPLRLRERQRLSDEACQALAKCVVPPLDMRRQSAVFAARRMLLCRDHLAISLPEVSVTMSRLISGWEALPQLLASRLRAVAHDIRHDLTSAPRERDPNPSLAAFLEDK